MDHGVILKHLEVDKITWIHLKTKNIYIYFVLRVALTAFSAGKRGGVPFF
jgi:hypothetical protein